MWFRRVSIFPLFFIPFCFFRSALRSPNELCALQLVREQRQTEISQTVALSKRYDGRFLHLLEFSTS